MIAKVQKWGNSLGFRVPKGIAYEAKITEGTVVDLSLEEGHLILKPLSSRAYKLNDLLKKVSAKNIHDEIATGAVVGGEVW